MPIPSGHWLATLRNRRHGIVALLLPSLLTWALSAPACAALRGETFVTAEPVVASSSEHHAHATQAAAALDHSHAPDTDSPAKCPHCATEHPAAVAHTCGVATDAATTNTAPQTPSFDAKLLLLTGGWLRPPSIAPPPLIAATTLATRPRAEPVPRNLLHCVFLV